MHIYYPISTVMFFTDITGTQEPLNEDTLLSIMQEGNIQQPAWEKIANKLGFGKILQGHCEVSPKSFLEGWHTFARKSQPSWELFGITLKAMNDYKQVAGEIQQNDGTCR